MKNIGRIISLISIIIVFSKIIGFLRQVVVAKYFGATIETDLIMLSQGIVSNLDYIITQIMITAFVSVYIHVKNSDVNDSYKLICNNIKIFFTLSILITILISILSNRIALIIAPSYDEILLNKLSSYIVCLSPSIILITLSAIFSAILNAHEKFVNVQITGIIQSVIIILFTIFGADDVGPDILIYGFLSSAIVNAVYLFICSRHYYYYVGGNPLMDSNVREMLGMILPLMFGYAMVFLNQQVDKVLVSGMKAGTVTALEYAAVISNLIATFLGMISTVIYTRITEYISKNAVSSAINLIVYYWGIVITILIPIIIFIGINSNVIVDIIFGYGKFEVNAVSITALALSGYAFLYIGFFSKDLFSRVYYAYKNTKIPMRNSIIGIAINIALSILLSRMIGVLGVTLATSAAEAVTGFLNIVCLRTVVNEFKFSLLLKYIPYWCIAIITTIIVYELINDKIFNYGNVTNMIISFIIIFVSYMFTIGITICGSRKKIFSKEFVG